MEGIILNTGRQCTLSADMIAQEPGDSVVKIMSQKAFTDMLSNWFCMPRVLECPLSARHYVYTGATIVPEFYGYLPTCMDIKGDLSAVNPGTYIAVFTPRENFCWIEGDTEPREVPWIIEAAK